MKTRKKRSPVWLVPEDEFIALIKNSQTMSQVLAYFKLQNKGGNFLTCKKRITELNLDTSHFLTASQSSNLSRKVTLEEFILRLKPESTWKNDHLKSYLVKFGLLDYKCNSCGNQGEWNGKYLSLQLEHKNGISNDHTITNLEFLCPNCHSQTDTFAGKSLKKIYSCEICFQPISKKSKFKKCRKCIGEEKRLYIRPTKEDLESLIKTQNVAQIARDLNLGSDNTVRKWCISYGIDYKKLSPFPRTKEKPIKTIKQPTSKYKYVCFESESKKWISSIKKTKTRNKFFKRFKTELEAAKAVANYFNSDELIIK